MTRRSRFILLMAAGGIVSAAGALIAGCMQSIDPDSDKGGVPPTTKNDGGASSSTGNGSCPTGEVCSTPGTTQCTLDSPECFYLCGSPLCALGPDPANADAGAAIPDAAAVPPIYLGSTDTQVLADGSTTGDPCVQIEALSLEIRQRSCSPCHEATAGTTKALCGCTLNYVMNDPMLLTGVSPDYQLPDGGSFPYITPGSPESSLIWYRINNTTMPPPHASADTLLGPEAGAALIYPSVEDVSILSQWITSCLTDAGLNPTQYYGGGLGGSQCFGPCGAADGGTVTTTTATPVVDAGAGDK
ncbi:MAG TPA: hypothetical protein VEK07_23705 [Polyangiaceae bacterium]|nr:hypothetical protein [Polyangiaceae bacterium]